MSDIRREMNQVINALENEGVDVNSHMTKDMVGLGDVVESTLKVWHYRRKIQRMV